MAFKIRWHNAHHTRAFTRQKQRMEAPENQDIISMPDKWEYPWYAAWDQSFQCISMAAVDPVYAKNQLLLLMREW